MAQAKVVVFGDQNQSIGNGMTGYRKIGSLSSQHIANMLGLRVMLPQPGAKARR
jgi:hypothetical protein